VEGRADGTEAGGGKPGNAAEQPSEDEIARAMIERIARQVDLEMGRVPLEPRSEGEEEGAETEPAAEPVAEAPEIPAAEEPDAPSEEDVSRELVERIAREVDEERHG
jgi:hypothetical protein